MPNFGRFLINILLYIFYTIIIAFLLWFIAPLILVSLGREIPVLSHEEYNLIFFVIAWLVFLLTLLFRNSCYISFKKYDEHKVSESYTQKKKREYNDKKKKSLENEVSDTDEDEIKIYVDREIQ